MGELTFWNESIDTSCEINLSEWVAGATGDELQICCRARRDELIRFHRLSPEQRLKSRSESGFDCLMCAMFARQRVPGTYLWRLYDSVILNLIHHFVSESRHEIPTEMLHHSWYLDLPLPAFPQFRTGKAVLAISSANT